MKNVSTAFKQAIANNQPIYAHAVITLADTTQLTLTSQNDFFISGNGYSEGGTDGFMLGETICKTINISIDNHDGRYSQYDFYKSKIALLSEIDLTNGTESIAEGIFTVIDSVTPGDIIEFTAYDNMYKTNKPYTNTHATALTAGELLSSVCQVCGLTIGTPHFRNNSNFMIKKVPTDCTCRDLIGYIAQIACGNAYILPNGSLAIKSYDLTEYNNIKIISGGKVTNNINDIINGGNVADSLTDVINGQTITDNVNYHILSEFTESPQIGTDDITITGVKYNDTLVGTDEYVLTVTNPLIDGNVLTGLNLIGENVIGMTVRPFSGSFLPNPLIECMDNVIVVDQKFNLYQSVVTNFSFNYLDNCEVANATKSPEKNDFVYSSSSNAVYQQSKELIEQEHTAWENAVEQLNNDLANSSGLYETKVVDPNDQSTIYYFHDLPDLNDSRLVIKFTENGVGISHDGVNGTYDTGFDFVNGSAVLQQIYTIGLNADCIKTGSLSADRIRGGTLTLGGDNDIYGNISVLDSSGDVISVINVQGILTKDNYNHKTRLSSTGLTSETTVNDVYKSCNYGLRTVENELGAVTFTNADFIGWTLYDSKRFWLETSPIGLHSVANFDMHNKQLQNAVLTDSTTSTSFTISANTQTNINSDVNMNANINMDGHNIDSPRFTTALTIGNNTAVNCYSDVDMHNFTINNTRIGNIVEINGNTPLTVDVPIVQEITFNNDNTVSVTRGTLRFNNGILVGWF